MKWRSEKLREPAPVPGRLARKCHPDGAPGLTEKLPHYVQGDGDGRILYLLGGFDPRYGDGVSERGQPLVNIQKGLSARITRLQRREDHRNSAIE